MIDDVDEYDGMRAYIGRFHSEKKIRGWVVIIVSVVWETLDSQKHASCGMGL